MRPSAISLALCGLLLVAGCSNKPILRDHYFGKAWIQGDKVVGPQVRDGNGNPVLEPGAIIERRPGSET